MPTIDLEISTLDDRLKLRKTIIESMWQIPVFLYLFVGSVLGASQASIPKINNARLMGHLLKLAEFGKTQKSGVSRVAYTDADKQGREYVMGLLSEAGLKVEIDKAGNLVGKVVGRKNLKPIVLGSHIDTVPEGGNYDGIVGSLSAIEVIQALKEAQYKTWHPLEVIIFQNEEGGHLGSRAITSGLTEEDLNLVSQSKKKVRDGIEFLGGRPAELSAAQRNPRDIAGYIELHIEQGGILEKERKDIGVVQGIVGIRRWNVTFEGSANHAGATPMGLRRDALLAAARFVDAAHAIVTRMPGRQVATVGKIEALPGAPNVIPGVSRLTIETRDLSSVKIDSISKSFFEKAGEIAKATGTKVSFEQTYNTPPCPTHPVFHRFIDESAKELGLSIFAMPSGAGHDAQEMARLGPMGMIFIPSANGISHSPEEFSDPKDIGHGADVLLRTLLKFDDSQK